MATDFLKGEHPRKVFLRFASHRCGQGDRKLGPDHGQRLEQILFVRRQPVDSLREAGFKDIRVKSAFGYLSIVTGMKA